MSRPKHSHSHRGLIVHEGHTHSVETITFSPDGKLVASGSWDNTIRFWDAYGPNSIGEPLEPNASTIYSLSYSPLGDMLASGSTDNTVRIWDTTTNRQIGEPLLGHQSYVYSVVFSPNGNLIASGSIDKTIRLWDVEERTTVSSPLEGHTSWVNSVAFSSDGTRVASGSDDNTIRVWDIKDGKTAIGALNGHEDAVFSVAFCPDGSQIVSGSGDYTLRFWDARTGNQIGNPYEGHTNAVYSVDFSPDGLYVASGSADHSVRIWDTRTGCQVDIPFEQHTSAVNSVAFAPHNRRVVSGSYDGRVMIWDLGDTDFEVEYDSLEVIDGDMEQLEVTNITELIGKHMSIQEMFDILSRHGCLNLSPQMDPKQDNAILISGGGFGDIWKGELYDGTKVAIKTWRSSLIEHCDYKILKRASREIYYWSKMKHENVHQLMGVIMFKSHSLGMVSEWVENGNLHEYMRRWPHLDRYQVCAEVASGLAYMHQRNAVHGDLKALNVLISSDGVAKLTDFGLSVMTEASIGFSETSNPQVGSTRWAAPELLLEGSSKSKHSDVYALGMTMLEVITGAIPYSQCQWDYQVLTKVLSGTLPSRPMELGKRERGNRMWELLVDCWDRNPDARPLAKEVVETLTLISLKMAD